MQIRRTHQLPFRTLETLEPTVRPQQVQLQLTFRQPRLLCPGMPPGIRLRCVSFGHVVGSSSHKPESYAGTSLGHGAKDVPTDQRQQTQSVQAKGPMESGRQGQAATLCAVAGAHGSLCSRHLAVFCIRGELALSLSLCVFSVSLCLSLSLCTSLHLSLSLSVYSLSLSVSRCLSAPLCISLSLSLSLSLSKHHGSDRLY